MLFKEKLPRDLRIAHEIIKLLIKKGNLNLIHLKHEYQNISMIYQEREYWLNFTMKCYY